MYPKLCTRKVTVTEERRRPLAVSTAPRVDPGLGALGEDHLGQRLPEQSYLRDIEMGSHEFLLAGPPPRPSRDQVAAGDGDLKEIGG